MSSDIKPVQELLEERRASRRVIYRRPRLTKSQLAAYYGLPDTSTVESGYENDDEGIDVEEESPPSSNARVPVSKTPKRRSHDPSETSKASITFSLSLLAVFDKTKEDASDDEEEEDISGNEEDEHTLDKEESPSPQARTPATETPKRRSHGPSETSNASITFSKSVLAVFDRTKTIEEESEEDESDDEQTVDEIAEKSKESARDPTETSKASITSSKSVLAVFDKTKTVEEESEEDEQIDAESPQRRSHGPSETSKASVTFSKSALGVFDKTRTAEEEIEEDEFDNEQREDKAPETPKRRSRGRNDTSKASITSSIERINYDLDNLSFGNENDFQSPRRMLPSVEDMVPITTDTDSLNTSLTEDTARRNNYDYDNDAANFSAASAPDHFDEEAIEPENIEPTLNDSVYSIHTPGSSRLRPILRSKPSIPLHFSDTLRESGVADQSIVKITAGLNKNKKKVRYVLAKPKLIKPESPSIEQRNLRRSRRTRVHRLRSDLGQVPIYEYDQNGLRTLVDVASVEILNPRAQKLLAVDAEEQNKREKELKNRRKSRKEFAKKQRGRETGDY